MLQSVKNKFVEKGVQAAICCLILDQMHKFYMLEIFNVEKIKFLVITPFLNIVLVWNRGISFGMFQGYEYSNYFFMGFTTAIIFILFYLLSRSRNANEAGAFGMIIGGACGNLADRIRTQAVADFFDFHAFGHHWPAFNIADTCVFFGAALLILGAFKKERS